MKAPPADLDALPRPGVADVQAGAPTVVEASRDARRQVGVLKRPVGEEADRGMPVMVAVVGSGPLATPVSAARPTVIANCPDPASCPDPTEGTTWLSTPEPEAVIVPEPLSLKVGDAETGLSATVTPKPPSIDALNTPVLTPEAPIAAWISVPR
jgi:hypothetical protein